VQFKKTDLFFRLENLRNGFPLMCAEALRSFNTGSPEIALRLVLGAEVFGIYRISQSIASVLRPALGSLENIVPKWLGQRMSQAQGGHVWKVYNKATIILFVLAAILLATVYLLSPWIVGAAFTEVAYDDVNGVIGVLCITNALFVVSRMLAYRLRSEGSNLDILRAAVTAGFIPIILGLPLIYSFGAIGAGLTIMIGVCVEITYLSATIAKVSRSRI